MSSKPSVKLASPQGLPDKRVNVFAAFASWHKTAEVLQKCHMWRKMPNLSARCSFVFMKLASRTRLEDVIQFLERNVKCECVAFVLHSLPCRKQEQGLCSQCGQANASQHKKVVMKRLWFLPFTDVHDHSLAEKTSSLFSLMCRFPSRFYGRQKGGPAWERLTNSEARKIHPQFRSGIQCEFLKTSITNAERPELITEGCDKSSIGAWTK